MKSNRRHLISFHNTDIDNARNASATIDPWDSVGAGLAQRIANRRANDRGAAETRVSDCGNVDFREIR